MRPQLKGVLWERVDDQLRLVYDPRDQLILDDPDGSVERLLIALRDGDRTTDQIADELGVAGHEVQQAVELLDQHRLVEDADRRDGFRGEQRERYFSNLAFFESFATLDTSREDFQRRLRRAHVLVLGTGGLNSNTIPHLCGLGVGRLTLVDRDVIDTRNFARQYLYQWRDRGAAKVDAAVKWVNAFDPTIEVTAVTRGVAGEEDVAELVAAYPPDVVMSGIDSPAAVDTWVNRACVRARVPYVRAGMRVTQGLVWSVDPGRGACFDCATPDPDSADPQLAQELAAIGLLGTRAQKNRGIGPVAGLLGALASFEVLRYLTGFEPPAYAGRTLYLDFANGCSVSQQAWHADPACATCASATVPVAAEQNGGR